MEFSLERANEILGRTPAVLKSLLGGISNDWSAPNEGGETWSAYDIVGHLIHGERTDWLVRLEIILGPGPNKTFNPFDRFAQFEESRGKTLDKLLDEFALLRSQNLQKLKELNIEADNLNQMGIHPVFREVTLRNLLATWVVHDLGHIAQISRVMAKQWNNEVGPWEEYLPILRR